MGHACAPKHFTTTRGAVTLEGMSTRWWATPLTVGVSSVLACSDWGWTRVARPCPNFELRAVIDEPDVFAPYSIDPESGAAATRSCPEVSIGKERVGAPNAGHDISFASSEDEGALRDCAKSAETAEIEILFGKLESSGKTSFRTYEVSRSAIVVGSDIARARLRQQQGDFSLELELTPRSQTALSGFVEQHIQGRMAVVLETKVTATPRISSAFNGHRVSLPMPDKISGEALLRKLTGT